MTTSFFIWMVAALSILGVIVRPMGWPEAVWTLAGSALLLASGQISVSVTCQGILKGTDVYLFLTGMMLLAEVAREEKLFDWLAAVATQKSRGSGLRLFVLIYGMGVVVTTFLSNDATAVVLTPAVAAAIKAANVRYPLPYLLSCAFIANAASFVLPISNPANLVIYGSHIPGLLEWLTRYGISSIVSISVTYGVLWWTQRLSVHQDVARDIPIPVLSAGGKTAAAGIVVTSLVLMIASIFQWPLGLPTALASLVTTATVLITLKKSPWTIFKNVSWSILPLVAGLFVLVGALRQTGVVYAVSRWVSLQALHSVTETAAGAGVALAFLSNLFNNLPVGLIAGQITAASCTSDAITRASVIGVDLGPNLSVTGSLATILWLTALRREGYHVTARAFLRLGILIMPTALAAALAVTVSF